MNLRQQRLLGNTKLLCKSGCYWQATACHIPEAEAGVAVEVEAGAVRVPFKGFFFVVVTIFHSAIGATGTTRAHFKCHCVMCWRFYLSLFHVYFFSVLLARLVARFVDLFDHCGSWLPNSDPVSGGKSSMISKIDSQLPFLLVIQRSNSLAG